MDSLFSPLRPAVCFFFFFVVLISCLYLLVRVRIYSCCWLYRREVGRLGVEKVGRGNERAVFMCTKKKKKKRGRREEERGREIKGGGGREWGWVNSEVRSSSPRHRFRPRLPGFLMSTAAAGKKERKREKQTLIHLYKICSLSTGNRKLKV